MSRTITKATLLEKLRVERSRLDDSLAQLTPEHMVQPGVDKDWSVKDILAHLTAWDQRGTAWLALAAAGETPAIPAPGLTWDDADSLNAATFQASQATPLATVLAEFQQAQARLVQQIEALAEDDLHKRMRLEPHARPSPLYNLIRWRYRHLRAHRKPIAAFVQATGQMVSLSDESLPIAPPVPPRDGKPPRGRAPMPTAPYVIGQRIADMHQDERPRERLLAYGPSVLSNAELLAILLRVGIQGENAVLMAQRILTTFDGLPGLARTSAQELGELKGLGEAKACQLLAALELGKRLAAASPQDRPVIGSPADAANLVLVEMGYLDHEQLRVMHLDVRNRVHGVTTVYKGAVNSAQVRVSEVFRDAVRHNHTALVLIHNHPSGDPTPSRDDIRITRDIVAAGELLGIAVLDHLVIGLNTFVSMKERGLGF